MTFLGWFAALVALLTGLAMLHDTYLTLAERVDLRAIVLRAWRVTYEAGWHAVDRHELSRAVRFFLRTSMLILIVAASGVCVLLPLAGGLHAGTYEVLLRCGLAAFMAMQSPCPWWRYILHGERRYAAHRIAQGVDRHVH